MITPHMSVWARVHSRARQEQVGACTVFAHVSNSPHAKSTGRMDWSPSADRPDEWSTPWTHVCVPITGRPDPQTGAAVVPYDAALFVQASVAGLAADQLSHVRQTFGWAVMPLAEQRISPDHGFVVSVDRTPLTMAGGVNAGDVSVSLVAALVLQPLADREAPLLDTRPFQDVLAEYSRTGGPAAAPVPVAVMTTVNGGPMTTEAMAGRVLAQHTTEYRRQALSLLQFREPNIGSNIPQNMDGLRAIVQASTMTRILSFLPTYPSVYAQIVQQRNAAKSTINAGPAPAIGTPTPAVLGTTITVPAPIGPSTEGLAPFHMQVVTGPPLVLSAFAFWQVQPHYQFPVDGQAHERFFENLLDLGLEYTGHFQSGDRLAERRLAMIRAIDGFEERGARATQTAPISAEDMDAANDAMDVLVTGLTTFTAAFPYQSDAVWRPTDGVARGVTAVDIENMNRGIGRFEGGDCEDSGVALYRLFAVLRYGRPEHADPAVAGVLGAPRRHGGWTSPWLRAAQTLASHWMPLGCVGTVTSRYVGDSPAWPNVDPTTGRVSLDNMDPATGLSTRRHFIGDPNDSPASLGGHSYTLFVPVANQLARVLKAHATTAAAAAANPSLAPIMTLYQREFVGLAGRLHTFVGEGTNLVEPRLASLDQLYESSARRQASVDRRKAETLAGYNIGLLASGKLARALAGLPRTDDRALAKIAGQTLGLGTLRSRRVQSRAEDLQPLERPQSFYRTIVSQFTCALLMEGINVAEFAPAVVRTVATLGANDEPVGKTVVQYGVDFRLAVVPESATRSPEERARVGTPIVLVPPPVKPLEQMVTFNTMRHMMPDPGYTLSPSTQTVHERMHGPLLDEFLGQVPSVLTANWPTAAAFADPQKMLMRRTYTFQHRTFIQHPDLRKGVLEDLATLHAAGQGPLVAVRARVQAMFDPVAGQEEGVSVVLLDCAYRGDYRY